MLVSPFTFLDDLVLTFLIQPLFFSPKAYSIWHADREVSWVSQEVIQTN